MVHFKTFLQALAVGTVALVGMTIVGLAWCGWLIMGIFLFVWAVNTRDLIRSEREPCDVCGYRGNPPRVGAKVVAFPAVADADGDCSKCGRPMPRRGH